MINILFYILISLAIWTIGALLSSSPSTLEIYQNLENIYRLFTKLLSSLLKLFRVLLKDLFNESLKQNASIMVRVSGNSSRKKSSEAKEIIPEGEYAAEIEDVYINSSAGRKL